MKRIERSLEDVEDFAALLAGPLGDTLRGSGVIIERRLRERRIVWADLDDQAVADLFIAALIQAVLDSHPAANRDVVEGSLATLASSIYMTFAANSDGGAGVH